MAVARRSARPWQPESEWARRTTGGGGASGGSVGAGCGVAVTRATATGAAAVGSGDGTFVLGGGTAGVVVVGTVSGGAPPWIMTPRDAHTTPASATIVTVPATQALGRRRTAAASRRVVGS